MKTAPSRQYVGLAVDPPADRREQAVLGRYSLVTGIEQQKAAGAVGVLRGAWFEAGLPEERGLLVAGGAGDWNRRAKERCVGFAIPLARGSNLGQHRARDAENLQ